MKKLNKKGFTIVELVIVIAVIAILAAVLIPTFASVINKANESAALQQARNVYTEYMADNAENGTAVNLIIEAGSNRFFIVKDGAFSTTIYSESSAASTALGAGEKSGTITSYQYSVSVYKAKTTNS